MKYLGLFAIAIFTLVATPLLVYQQVANPENAPGPIFVALWIAGIGSINYNVLFREVREIRTVGEGIWEFRGILRRTRVSAGSIIRIKPYLGSNYYVQIRHEGGKLVVLQPMDGFYRFLAAVKRINPAAEIAGL